MIVKNTIKPNQVMRYMDWSKIIHTLYFHPDFVKEPLSLALKNMVVIGNVVTLDEKLKFYSGQNSPVLHRVLQSLKGVDTGYHNLVSCFTNPSFLTSLEFSLKLIALKPVKFAP